MIDVKHKTCEAENCKTIPTYNFEGEKRGKYCKNHKLEDMIDVISKTCEFENCKVQPLFNFEGEKQGKYCKNHKLEDMINVISKTCEAENCKVRPFFNYEGEKQGKYCKNHKLEDMIDVKNKTCEVENCKTIPVFNYEGENKAKYCSKHKLDGMIDVKSKICKTHLCSTLVKNKYEGYCLRCYIYTFPDKPVSRNYKTKETTVVDFIKENFSSQDITTDRTIQGGCSRRRPDALINLGHRVLIVEIDENQHTDYDCSCENKRIMELYQDVEFRPIVFIRFNPDDYINDKGEKIKSCWDTNSKGIFQVKKNKQNEWNLRLESLKTQIDYWIENESDKAIEIVQLYYD
jgi:hypothetical protein